jgi:low temperature requirement protein LtrA
MNQDIVRADKEFRKRFIIFLVLIVIVFVITILSMKSYLDQIAQLAQGNPDLAAKKVMFLLRWWLGFGSLPILGLAVYQILLAGRVLKSGQFPPPGMKLVRDTKIRTGRKAKKVAISLIVLSSIIIVITLFLVYWPYAFEKKLLKKKSSNEKIRPTHLQPHCITPFAQVNGIRLVYPLGKGSEAHPPAFSIQHGC